MFLLFLVMNLRRFSIMTLFLLTALSTSAFGFDVQGIQPVQPLGAISTMNAFTVGKENIGVMLGIEKSVDPNFYRLSLNAEYGLLKQVDLLASLPLVVGLSGSEGMQDITIGLKHSIITEKRYGPSFSYIVDFSLPGREELSIGGRVGGGLILTKRLGPFSGNLNLFYHIPFDSDYKKEIELRFGLDLAAVHNVNLLTEIIIKKSHFSVHIDQVEGRGGYRVKLSPDTYVTLGLGYDFKNREPELRFFFLISTFFYRT